LEGGGENGQRRFIAERKKEWGISVAALMPMFRYCFLICLSTIPVLASSQYFQFSQYNFSVQRVNPAWVGLTPDALVDFAYRNQKTGGDFQLNTNFLSVAYPFFQRSTGRPWGGLGVSVLSDRSGPLFKSQEAAATFAVNISTGLNQNLSLGFKALARWQRINMDGLFTGSQYLEGHGFQPALDNGEIPQPFQNKFYTLSSGMLWQQTDRRGRLLAQFGFSFFDFNKPNPAFLDGSQDELPSTFLAHGALLAYHRKQMSIVPEFLLTSSSSKKLLVAGGKFQYDLDKINRVDVFMKYAVGRSGIAGFQLHRKNFSIGFSYDFPIIFRNAGNLGAFEVGLEYRTPVDPKSKRDYARKKSKKRKAALVKRKADQQKSKISTTAKAKPNADSNQNPIGENTSNASAEPPADSASVTMPSVEIMKIEQNINDPKKEASAGRISHEPHIIEKITLHFRFEYNSANLDDETEKFLEELSRTLMGNPTMSVKITGHTDNVGSAHLNHKLSVKRAEVVKAHLVHLGVPSSRVFAEGKGMDNPLNGNRTEEDRAKNRRVEINLISEL
jgi:type IX secretion system PorP/SprF family membrane protein